MSQKLTGGSGGDGDGGGGVGWDIDQLVDLCFQEELAIRSASSAAAVGQHHRLGCPNQLTLPAEAGLNNQLIQSMASTSDHLFGLSELGSGQLMQHLEGGSELIKPWSNGSSGRSYSLEYDTVQLLEVDAGQLLLLLQDGCEQNNPTSAAGLEHVPTAGLEEVIQLSAAGSEQGIQLWAAGLEKVIQLPGAELEQEIQLPAAGLEQLTHLSASDWGMLSSDGQPFSSTSAAHSCRRDILGPFNDPQAIASVTSTAENPCEILLSIVEPNKDGELNVAEGGAVSLSSSSPVLLCLDSANISLLDALLSDLPGAETLELTRETSGKESDFQNDDLQLSSLVEQVSEEPTQTTVLFGGGQSPTVCADSTSKSQPPGPARRQAYNAAKLDKEGEGKRPVRRIRREYPIALGIAKNKVGCHYCGGFLVSLVRNNLFRTFLCHNGCCTHRLLCNVNVIMYSKFMKRVGLKNPIGVYVRVFALMLFTLENNSY